MLEMRRTFEYVTLIQKPSDVRFSCAPLRHPRDACPSVLYRRSTRTVCCARAKLGAAAGLNFEPEGGSG